MHISVTDVLDSHLLPRSIPIGPGLPRNIDTRQRVIVTTCAIAPLFTISCVGLRLYARRVTTYKFQFDDVLTVFTLLLCIGYSILLASWTARGAGMHEVDLTRLGLEQSYYTWMIISSPVYLLACTGYKVIIMLLYLRLFPLQRKTSLATSLIMAVAIISLVCNIVVQIFGCRPVSYFWKRDGPGSCFDFAIVNIAFGSLGVVIDFAILLLPLPAVWLSRLASREKLGVSLVFLSGAGAFAVALVRFRCVVNGLTTADHSYNTGLTMLWQVLEIHTGLMCACAPALKPLYRRVFSPDALARFQPGPASKGSDRFQKLPQDPYRLPTIDEDELAAAARLEYRLRQKKTSRNLRITVPKKSSLIATLQSPWIDRFSGHKTPRTHFSSSTKGNPLETRAMTNNSREDLEQREAPLTSTETHFHQQKAVTGMTWNGPKTCY